MMWKPSKKLLKWGLPIGIALLLAACGGNSNEAGSTPSASASATETAEPSTPAPSESASPSPSSSETAESVKEGYKLYTSPTEGVSIQYPEDWELNEGVSGSVAAFLTPVEDDKDTFQENVNIVVQDLQGQDISLEQYAKLSEEQVKQTFGDTKIITSEPVQVNGMDMQRLIYTGTQEQFKLKWQQLYTIQNGKAYIISYTAAQDKYDQHVDKMEEMSGTFTVK